MGSGQEATDRDLVQRARRGDSVAFHQLVDRHAQALYGLAVRLVGNAADADDVVQETFAGAFGGLAAFREQAAVKTWLTQILVRQAARHHRSRRLRLAEPLAHEPARPADAAAQNRADFRLDLGGALAALGPEHREVIVLRELQGLPYDEIAAILGVPRGTVESRLFRARRELQELLKDYLP